ncbi:hypothetical protein SGGMMB4_03586 [Sodalis glossinidius str. 'morsitans']|uniref:Manganese transport system membrane protein MntB n=1 Tax=Sodalis glossinidius (strain morsitans) TaxID=343509 RepID=A0A193QL44_SODGM|nr:hypothetical protein SGGMMB4_03586 [Sodalis glossinidius str. 'morsitans']
MGYAISHAVLPGIVLAFAAGVPLAVSAFVAGSAVRRAPAIFAIAAG